LEERQVDEEVIRKISIVGKPREEAQDEGGIGIDDGAEMRVLDDTLRGAVGFGLAVVLRIRSVVVRL
jgi:hypothetical protein